MERKLKELIEKLNEKLTGIDSLNDINQLKAEYLGKKSVFSDFMQGLKEVPIDERPKFGQMINEAKNKISELLDSAKFVIEKRMVENKLKAESIDVTLPGKKGNLGSKHLISQVIEEVEDIFLGLGYTVKEGPEVESDLYNFEMTAFQKDKKRTAKR